MSKSKSLEKVFVGCMFFLENLLGGLSRMQPYACRRRERSHTVTHVTLTKSARIGRPRTPLNHCTHLRPKDTLLLHVLSLRVKFTLNSA